MEKSIYISPSTQENNIGKGSYGTEEKRMNQVADVVVPELIRHGVTVYRNRPAMTLRQVIADSNAKKAALHFAIHSNAAGKPNTGARGAEVYCHKYGGVGEQMARNVYAELEPLTPTADRGVKEGCNFFGPGKGLAELQDTTMPAALAEIDFHDDDAGAAWIVDHIQLIGVAIAKGLLKTLGIAYKEPETVPAQPPVKNGTPLLGPATATVEQAREWIMDVFTSRKWTDAAAQAVLKQLQDLATLYWRIWPACGLNPAIGFVQMTHETGYLYMVKSAAGLDASYCNPCGLKVTTGGGDYQASAHKKFPNWAEGVTAHADHAALYAGAPGYPKAGTPDPRHFPAIKGTAPYLEQLGGKWAPSLTYGTRLAEVVKQLEATKAPQQPSEDVATLKARITDLEGKLAAATTAKQEAERTAEHEKQRADKYMGICKQVNDLTKGVTEL